MSNSALELIRIGLVLPRSPATWRSMRASRSASPFSGRRPRAERIVALAWDESFFRVSASATVPRTGSLDCCSRRTASASFTGRSIHLASRSSASSGGGSNAASGWADWRASAVVACAAGASGSATSRPFSERLHPAAATAATQATAAHVHGAGARTVVWLKKTGLGDSGLRKSPDATGPRGAGSTFAGAVHSGNLCPSFSRFVARYRSLNSWTGGRIGTWSTTSRSKPP